MPPDSTIAAQAWSLPWPSYPAGVAFAGPPRVIWNVSSFRQGWGYRPPAPGRVALAEAFDELSVVLDYRSPITVAQLCLDVVRGADELAAARLFAATVAIRCPWDRDRKRAAFARQA